MKQLKKTENRLFQNLINQSVISWLVFSTIGLFLVFYRSDITGWGFRENVQVTLWLGVLLLAIFRNKLSVHFKAGSMAIMLSSLAIMGVLTLGVFAAALHFIPLIGILLLLFFQNKVVEKYYLIILFLLSLAGLLFVTDQVSIGFDANALLTSWQHWVLVLLCFTFYLFFSNTAVVLYKREMASLLTQLSAQNDKLKQASFIDTLTGLPLLEKGEHQFEALLSSLNQENQAAVMYLDLDEFKVINEVYGHEKGDWCIKETARRLEKVMGNHGFVVRVGSDEFLLVYHGFDLKVHAISWATKMLNEIQKPVALDRVNLKLSSSVGISFYPDDGKNFSTLRRKADLAMYQAKVDENLSISTYKSATS